MFPVVILAGGRGARMGGPKGLIPFGAAGTPLLVWSIQRHRAAGGREAVVVLGHEAAAYLLHLPENGVTVAHSAAPELGPFASLTAGIAAMTEAPAVFVLPVDVPAAQVSTWAILARAFLAAAPGSIDAVLPRYGDRGGHPVLLSLAMARHLTSVPLDGADDRHDMQLRLLPPERVLRVEVADPLVVLDLNTPADVEAVKNLIT
jgi:CTP:molybdopterin cytidylyltransferase MocA